MVIILGRPFLRVFLEDLCDWRLSSEDPSETIHVYVEEQREEVAQGRLTIFLEDQNGVKKNGWTHTGLGSVEGPSCKAAIHLICASPLCCDQNAEKTRLWREGVNGVG